MGLAEKFFSQKSVACGRSVTPFLWAKRPLPPPPKKTASAAKPILACMNKTLTMGARRSCGKLEEDPLDIVQSFLWALTLMTLLGALAGWFWLGRLFAQRVNVETKDYVTIVRITWLPQLPFRSSLLRQSIFVPRMQMASYPTSIRTFNPSMWETWIS